MDIYVCVYIYIYTQKNLPLKAKGKSFLSIFPFMISYKVGKFSYHRKEINSLI